MANLVVCAWLVTVLGATVVLLTAAVLPRWVKVCANMDGMVEEADVGLWQMCRPHNCTTLTTSTTAGQRSVISVVVFQFQLKFWITGF